ncbi:MAG TPA: response regulator [Vicinamibacterales bacterium]|nr:response regulator [Vicinamibacterales bacterium]
MAERRTLPAHVSEGTILLVDDDTQMRGILRANFEVVGYDVVDAPDEKGAIAALGARRPDAIVVDVLPASSNGPALVRSIRRHPRGKSVPVIVLSARIHRDDAVRSLEAGADDVVVRPFAPEEMMARVRGKIRRAAEHSALQPLTNLPGNGPIEAEIRRRLSGAKPWAILYLDLDGFKAFNDAFGFAKGDQVIKLLAATLDDAVRKHGEGDDFVGHIGGDDFVAVMRPARAEQTAQSIVAAFDREIRTVQRDTRVPYCTVSIAIVNGSRGNASYEKVCERAASLKKEAKRRRGSVVISEPCP